MITEVSGNILDFPNLTNCIAHSCNTKCLFGAGLALQIKNEYPSAYEADCEAARKGENTLGNMSMATLSSGKRIINMYTQANIGTEKRQVSYDALFWCLETLKLKMESALKEGREYRLGLPYGLSCGLAGGSWTVVYAMIEDLFLDSPLKLTIVKFESKVNKNV